MHCLHEGQALCGRSDVPGDWPQGHVWLSKADWSTTDVEAKGGRRCARCDGVMQGSIDAAAVVEQESWVDRAIDRSVVELLVAEEYQIRCNNTPMLNGLRAQERTIIAAARVFAPRWRDNAPIGELDELLNTLCDHVMQLERLLQLAAGHPPGCHCDNCARLGR